MRKILTIILQTVVVLIGIGTLVAMLWEPHLEGRNVNATVFEIYFNDPFLAYVYLGSIPFFVILYQMFKLLGYFETKNLRSLNSLKALRIIKNCAFALIALVGGAVAYIAITMYGKDDIAGGVAVGLFMIFVSTIISFTAAAYERILQNTLNKEIV